MQLFCYYPLFAEDAYYSIEIVPALDYVGA